MVFWSGDGPTLGCLRPLKGLPPGGFYFYLLKIQVVGWSDKGQTQEVSTRPAKGAHINDHEFCKGCPHALPRGLAEMTEFCNGCTPCQGAPQLVHVTRDCAGVNSAPSLWVYTRAAIMTRSASRAASVADAWDVIMYIEDESDDELQPSPTTGGHDRVCSHGRIWTFICC